MQLQSLSSTFVGDTHLFESIQNHVLGAIGYDTMNRKYRYGKVGAVALVRGNLLQTPARDVQFTDMAVAAAAIGATEISVTLGSTATTAGMFSEGVLVVTVAPGIGQQYVIKSHQVTAGAGTCIFKLYEPLQVALTTSSKVTTLLNPYNGIIQSPTTRTGRSAGVALAAGAIGAFGFIAVEGEFGVLSDVTVAAVGESLSPSTTTAGAVTKQVTLLETVGTACLLGVSAKTEPAYLRMP